MRSQWQWIISGVLLLVVGIFILVNPQTVLRAAVIAFGIYMVVEALMSLIVSWQIKSLTGIFRVNSARSIIGLIIGVSATVAGVGASDGQIARRLPCIGHCRQRPAVLGAVAPDVPLPWPGEHGCWYYGRYHLDRLGHIRSRMGYEDDQCAE